MAVGAGAEKAAFRRAVNARLVELLRTGSIALAVLLSGFVLHEPAPYELFLVVLIPVWALFGLRLSRHIAPLIALLVLFNVGGLLAMTQMDDLGTAPTYIAVSLFLAFTSIFFAAVIEAHPSLLPVIFRAWTFTAVGTTTLGVLGYFHALPGAEAFTRYGRAAGGFEDPNVFGPFLLVPSLYLLQRIMTGTPREALTAVPPLLFILFGIFLSFSRGAWGLFLFSAAILTATQFIYNRSGLIRMRILLMCIAGATVLAIGILIALQIPAIAALLEERARLVQDYDGARMGRFARFILGFELAMERPFGIGPLVFGPMFGEDTHNIWLKTLLDYSWLGFAAYFTLTVLTIAGSLKILFRHRPWQPYLACVFAAFIGHVALGSIIDTDHWRHFYLILGVIWGLMALEQRYQRAVAGSAASSPHGAKAASAITVRSTASGTDAGVRYTAGMCCRTPDRSDSAARTTARGRAASLLPDHLDRPAEVAAEPAHGQSHRQ